jgi:hypothetical protein
VHSWSAFDHCIADTVDIRGLEAPAPPLSLRHPSGIQATNNAHSDAHSDPGHQDNNGRRVAGPRRLAPQDAQRRMSNISDGKHEQRAWENPPEHAHNDGSGHEKFSAKADSTYLEQVSESTCSEDNRVHLGSPRSAAPSRSCTERSILWQKLREKRAEVLNFRITLREARASLRARQKAIDDVDEQFLPEMTAALTDFSIPAMKDVFDGFRASQTTRQGLRSDLEALEQLEQQLISDEEVLADLETDAYAEISSPTEFPGGFLDFTQDNGPDTASVISVPIKASPAKQDYDRCLRAVNVIRERLLDLESENEQLLREQERRNKLGRTLDAFSVQTLHEFKERFNSLTLDLDQAQAEFVIAEATWTSRRKIIEREDDEFETMQPVPFQEPSSILLDDFYNHDEDVHDSLDLLVEEDERASAIAFKLFQAENEPRLVYDLPSEAENGEIVNQARFISQWLLQQVHQSPEETKRFAKFLAERLPSFSAQVLVDNALSCWMQDGTEEDFIANIRKGADSKAQSLTRTPSGQLARSEGDNT